jgi:multiple sugar transport system substrate-binding protein
MSDHPIGDLSRRRFLGIAAGAGAGALLAGCGGKSGPPGQSTGGQFTGKYTGPKVTLAYWNGFTGGDGPHMRKMVQDFNGQHDNIEVRMTTMQWADYYQKVPAAVVSGKGPDLGIAHQDNLATLAARRSVLPLDDVANDLGLREDEFIPAIWKAGIYQDKRYGIPLDVHSLAMYWNKDLAAKAQADPPPSEGQAYEQALAKLVSGGVTDPFWMPSQWPAHLMFLSLLWQNGGAPYSDDGTKATFNSDAGVTALTWMVDQIKKGYSPKNVALDTQYNAFKIGKNAITWDGIWQINDLKTTAPKLKWGIDFLPQIGSEAAVWANGHNFVLMSQRSADDNKMQAAKVFIDYISKQSIEWARSGMIPARNSVRDSADFGQLTQATVAKKVDSMRFMTAVPGIGDVNTQTFQNAVAKATLLQQSPKEALDQAAGQADKLLADNRKKFGS